MSDDGTSARNERDIALEQVSDKAGSWMLRAMTMLRTQFHGEATGEQIRLALMAAGLPPPHHHNAWGAFINAAIRLGILEPTGRKDQMHTPRSHARSTQILRKRGEAAVGRRSFFTTDHLARISYKPQEHSS